MASFEYIITEPMGLHARPAGLLVKQLKNYISSVEISCGERKADAKKLFALMNLGIKCGDRVTVTVSGEDEHKAVQEIQNFFTQNI
ncbi:HPr family phosphocarrier protein [Caproiciproducens sp.]|uniref:HPr family phosphocarrier protein n=1 Tax=Caproiciproducens sp. TaxID=1954376 RepID=UPI00289690A1|nr:HPr family phosphocarrier protein [Caproiciproducens sp.]